MDLLKKFRKYCSGCKTTKFLVFVGSLDHSETFCSNSGSYTGLTPPVTFICIINTSVFLVTSNALISSGYSLIS